MLTFRTLLDHTRAGEVTVDAGFSVAGQTFRARLADGQMPVTRENLEGAQIVFSAPSASLIAAHILGKLPAGKIPGLEFSGDAALAARFIDLFDWPLRTGGRPA